MQLLGRQVQLLQERVDLDDGHLSPVHVLNDDLSVQLIIFLILEH